MHTVIGHRLTSSRRRMTYKSKDFDNHEKIYQQHSAGNNDDTFRYSIIDDRWIFIFRPGNF